MSNLIRTPQGKVDHPKNSSKDLADAIANAAYNCYHHLAKQGYKLESSSTLKVVKSNFTKLNSNKIKKLALNGRDKLRKFVG